MINKALREKGYLRLRYRTILSYTGVVLVLCGTLMLSPLLLLPFYPEEIEYAWAFGGPAAVLLVMGLLLWWILRPATPVALTTQEGGVIVLLSWIIVMLFSAWPFAKVLDLDFTRALFESVSGWTTTGLSVVDVSKAGKLILLWRSTMQLAGGAGLAILMMSAIIGPAGAGLASAEGRSAQLVPHVKQSARLVVLIYCGYATAGIIGYRLTGMSLFDAINHAFAVVSTGGFSTRADSIGFWNSVSIEAVSLPLMVLGNTSFITAWLLFRGKFRFVTRSGEIRLVAVLVPLVAATLFMVTCRGIYPQLGKSVRVSVFETVTALTTTGFSTVSYGDWNSFGILFLIVLMLIGGGTCSTAGGVKQYRIYMLWKLLLWDFRRAFLPRMAVMERPVWEGDRKVFVRDEQLRQISSYVFLYGSTFVAGTLIISASGYSMQDALFEFASALGTVGLSVGVTSASAPDTVLWTEIVAMFLGRLEFLVLITSAFRLVGDLRRML